LADLKKLFDRIVGVSGKEPLNEFYEDWLKLMGMYKYEMVEKAWNQIRVEVDNYKLFNLKLWYDKCDYLYSQSEFMTKLPKKQTKTRVDDDMRAWRENLRQYQEREITRRQYLDNALKTGQMLPHEYDKEKKQMSKLQGGLDEYHGKKVMDSTI